MDVNYKVDNSGKKVERRNVKMQMKKIGSLLFALVMLCLCMLGCGESTNESASGEDGKIELNGNSISAGSGVKVAGSVATITDAGTYEISGTLNDGQIVVDASGSVTLVLNNADITCTNSAPIFVKAVGHVIIELADGTVNTITDGESYDLSGTAAEADAAIYTKSDMTITGGGSLVVNANYNDGITGKDTLLIESGNISVNAVKNGIKGKDYLMITGGSISVNAGGDGLKSTNDTQASLGYVEITGGNVDIVAVDEGIAAVTDVMITGGEIYIETDNNGIKSDDAVTITGGSVDIETADDGIICTRRSIGENAEVIVNGEKLS